MLIFKSKLCVSNFAMNFIICKNLIISSITPPPEKALELPKEWISIGTTVSENMPTSQQVENILDIVDV